MRLFRTIFIGFTSTALLSASAGAQILSGSGGIVTTTANGQTGISVTASTSASPDVIVKTGDSSSSSAFRVFNSTGTDLFRVQSDGYVGIGNIIPTMKLSIGGSGQVFGVGNSSTFAAKTSAGTYENYLTPRFSDNVMYLNFGSGGFNIRNASDITAMFMDNAGNVSVGSPSHVGHRLDVFGIGRYGYDFTTMPNPAFGGIQIGQYGAGGAGELQFLTGSASAGYGFRFRGASNGALLLERRWASGTFSDFMAFADQGVGIGTASPTGVLQLSGAGSSYVARFVDSVWSGVPNGLVLDMTANSEIHIGGMQIGKMAMPIIQTQGAAGLYPLYLNRDRDNTVVIGQPGFTGAGLDVQNSGISTFAGSITVAHDLTVSGILSTGTIYANYQDVAEWVPSAESLPEGAVVIQSDEINNAVEASAHAYDTRVAGVVSLTPGLLLGKQGPDKAKIATTGRVRVRVDAKSAPIRRGDLLVTSDRPGMAMRSQPLDLGGVKIHRPGTLIGKALEPLPSGEGEILVLLSLQ